MPDIGKKVTKLTLHKGLLLKQRSVTSIISILGKLSVRWLDKNYAFRKKAVKRLVEKSHFTEAMSNALLDSLFHELTQTKLLKLLKAELGDPRVLDEFRYDKLTLKWQRARGPHVITHIFSGNVPNPAIVSFILGMLVKSVNIGKISSRDGGFLDIYLESLKDHDKELAATNYVLQSNVGARRAVPLQQCIQQSDLVIAYGNNESLVEIRNQVPVTTPFVGYGHRMSFGIYAKQALNKKNLKTFAMKTAHDIWMTDQRGCLSPIEVFIERGGEVSIDAFSEELVRALNRAYSAKFWRLADSTKYILGIGGRKLVSVRGVKNMEDLSKILLPFRNYLQAVSLETGNATERRACMAEKFSCLGINRICRAGRMQVPPITWHHDGKFNLASWVNWTDLEA